MPLTDFQARLLRLLARNRTFDSHLAGGAALHIEPQSERYSNDLDFFHDSVERVAQAFASDRQVLDAAGYRVVVDLALPGYLRAVVSLADDATKVEWAHDSAWRFLPVIEDERCGYLLHPLDLAINKLLALVGRDEPRDFLDTLFVHRSVLPLGALCWAASGKDPGFTPFSLLDLLRRRGKYRSEDFERLHLVKPVDVAQLKQVWLAALAAADGFVRARPAQEVGCLYYAPALARFVAPDGATLVVPHFGRPGGVLPVVRDA